MVLCAQVYDMSPGISACLWIMLRFSEGERERMSASVLAIPKEVMLVG